MILTPEVLHNGLTPVLLRLKAQGRTPIFVPRSCVDGVLGSVVLVRRLRAEEISYSLTAVGSMEEFREKVWNDVDSLLDIDLEPEEVKDYRPIVFCINIGAQENLEKILGRPNDENQNNSNMIRKKRKKKGENKEKK